MSSDQPLKLSPTVERTRKQLSEREEIFAYEIVDSILTQHTEYAEQIARPTFSVTTDAKKRHVDAWLNDVRSLFEASPAPELHGRLVIIGLSMLAPSLKQQLNTNNFLITLEKELTPSVDAMLSDHGRQLWKSSESGTDTETETDVIDSVSNYPDDPLQKTQDDQLGRAAYGRYLAERIRAVPPNQAYALHVYGPWGAGKTTLLNFLATELEKDNWLVVTFNAWRSQHIRPPWWAMLDRIFQESKNKKTLRGWHLIQEYGWRLALGRAHYFLGLFVLALIAGIGSYWLSNTGDQPRGSTMDFWVTLADNLGTILATAVAVWAAAQTISRSMTMRSSQAAQSYMKMTADPMGQMANRFKKLIERIEAKRVAIFIDDLDRCQSDYVVDLLEGIQTLFREAPVIFIVAADQHWLDASFEEVYGELQHHVQEPGKPLGTLFLEKVFQFSTPVPGIPAPLREAYWRYLLHMKEKEPGHTMDAARASAKATMEEKQSESEMLEAIDQSQGQSFAEGQALREEMVIKMATPTIMEDIEKHTLDPFAPLLEPNPRSMKRLVNAYSVNRALSTLGHLDIPQEKLALWTILAMRWPILAEYLEDKPDDIGRVGQQNNFEDGEALADLFMAQDVITVVQGGGITAALDADTIEQCALLRM